MTGKKTTWQYKTALLAIATAMPLMMVGMIGGQGTAHALSITQSQNVQKWCGPFGRLCYNPQTTRWTWKKKRRS